MTQIGGLEALVSALAGLTGEYEKAIQAELESAGNTTLPAAQALAPVLTGAMRDSGHVDSAPLNVTVTFDADYSIDVEMGHMSRAGNPVPAQHFLLPPFNDEADALQKRLENL